MTPPYNANLLVVDDDPDTRELLDEILSEEGYRVTTAADAEQALAIGRDVRFGVIISDMRLGSDQSGLDVLRAYKRVQPDSEVILITAFGSLETAVEAVKAGAFDYLSKPFKIEDVLHHVRRALDHRELVKRQPTVEPPPAEAPFSMLVGRSAPMLEVYKKIAMVSATRSTVLIYGESGTGKELVARAIHANGPRAGHKFLAVNCGAFTESLLESELFGHVRGSFTGATATTSGIFGDASAGTVFLDEVSEMSSALQVKLLRALEAQEVRPVGSAQPVKIDVRVIAASNRRLPEMVEQGKFREDLYYRLRVIEIDLPPLRDRGDDITLLVEHTLGRLGREAGRQWTISPRALEALAHYDWPGNVRELEHAIESAVALNRTGVIAHEDLPAKVRGDEAQADRSAPEPGPLAPLYSDLPSLDELERRYLMHVLKATGDNKSDAAQVLGISRRTLYRMLDRWTGRE